MTHIKDFQDSLPVFVKSPSGVTWNGRFYARGKEFPWKTLACTFDQARTLFYSHVLYHSSELTTEIKVGDGLDSLTIEQLQAKVDEINTKVKTHTKNKTEFDRKKCKKSSLVLKQRGLIRQWRSIFGHMENKE